MKRKRKVGSKTGSTITDISYSPKVILKATILACHICRNCFPSREQLNSHCKEVHNISLNNSPKDDLLDKEEERLTEPTEKHRKVKPPLPSSSSDVNDGAVEVEESAVSKKVSRGRGRPRKHPITHSPNNASDDDLDPEHQSPNLIKGDAASPQEAGTSSKSGNMARKSGLDCPVPDCLRTLKNRYWYTNHLEIHEGSKPFVCEYCEYGYEDAIKLMEHVVLKHTKDPGFQCTECQSAYKTKRCLDNHMAKCHSN